MPSSEPIPDPSPVDKALPAGASVNPSGTQLVQAAAIAASHGGSAAQGMRPTPGPLPPIDQPVETAFRYQFPWATNQTWTPRQGRIGYEVLRTFADCCDVVRTCIETRKDQMCSLDWEITGRDKAKPDKSKLAKALKFFESPDASGDGFETWFRCAMEEVLVCDNLTLYRHPTRGGQFGSLDIVNGDLFKVLVDDTGRIPMPPNKAYRQIIYGAPTRGGDYSKDEIYYLPKTVRTWTPYGLSPIESILVTIITLLNRQTFDASYYTDGNTPPGLLEVGNVTTPDQLRAMQTYLDEVLSGNTASRQRIKIIPKDSEYTAVKQADFNAPYFDLLVKIVCAAMAVPPQEIGWTADINKATGKQQENIVYRRGIKPLAAFFKNIFDRVLAHDLQLPELQFVFTGGEPSDKLIEAQVDKIHVDMGKTSVDELRARDGEEPIGLGAYVSTAAGPVLVSDLLTKPAEPSTPGAVVATPAAAAVLESPDAEDDDLGAPPEIGEVATAKALGELRTWRASAIKAIKKGPLDGRVFQTTAVPATVAAMVDASLTKAVTVADVVKIFGAAEASVAKASKAKVRKQREAALEGMLASYFSDLRKQVIAHVSAQVG